MTSFDMHAEEGLALNRPNHLSFKYNEVKVGHAA